MAEKLSEEQVAEFKEAFDKFDKDKDGTISVQELGTVMQELGLKPSEAELKVLIARLDTDNNGIISFQEFLEAMATGLQTSDTEEDLREIFRAFDQDNDGYISVDELRQATSPAWGWCGGRRTARTGGARRRGLAPRAGRWCRRRGWGPASSTRRKGKAAPQCRSGGRPAPGCRSRGRGAHAGCCSSPSSCPSSGRALGSAEKSSKVPGSSTGRAAGTSDGRRWSWERSRPVARDSNCWGGPGQWGPGGLRGRDVWGCRKRIGYLGYRRDRWCGLSRKHTWTGRGPREGRGPLRGTGSGGAGGGGGGNPRAGCSAPGPGRAGVEVSAECRGLGKGEQKSTANLGALETIAR